MFRLKTDFGISLTELLISLLLTSFLIIAAMHCYLGSKKMFDENLKDAKQSLELSLVSDLLVDMTRQAGFTPCQSIDNLEIFDPLFPQKKFQAALTSLSGSYLQTMRMSENFFTVKKVSAAHKIELITTNFLATKHRWLIADCLHAEIVEIAAFKTRVHSSEITLRNPLHFSYEKAYFGEWREEKVFLQKTTKDAALYYQDGHEEKISSLIKQFKVSILPGLRHKLLLVKMGTEIDKNITVLTSFRNQ